jgi:ABC-2 type transport system permease protein
MKDLLYKEFKLALHPSIFIYLFFGALLLIPSWMYFIAFGYIFIGFFNMFTAGRANQDIFFTVCLPIQKRDMVRARIISITLMELLQIAFAIPFAFINNNLYPDGNFIAMDVNSAFFGCVFILYAIFNIVFFPAFFKTAYKAGVPCFLGVLALSVFAVAVEFAVQIIPVLKTNLDTLNAAYMTSQLYVLIAGIAVFAFATWLAYKKSVKNFEKVDL